MYREGGEGGQGLGGRDPGTLSFAPRRGKGEKKKRFTSPDCRGRKKGGGEGDLPGKDERITISLTEKGGERRRTYSLPEKKKKKKET